MNSTDAAGFDVMTTSASELSAVMHPPVACRPDTPLREALATMHARQVGSIVITTEDDRPVGIFTLRDVLDRVVLADEGLDRPISSVMSTDLHTLPPSALVYEAVLPMLHYSIRHILIVENGRLTGLVSEKDLFALQPGSVRQLAAAIRNAPGVEDLVALSEALREHTRSLLLQGTAPEPLTLLISSLNDLLTQRVLDLEFSGVADEVRFCWIALGSEGRREQTLYTDQDNGLIFTTGGGPDAGREKLLPHARRVNDALARCGVPLCPGNIMAGNPAWCLSLDEWDGRFADWIEHGDPQALLKSAIFFDFRPIHGERDLADALRGRLFERIARAPRFLHQMAANALHNRPPLGLLGTFTTSSDEGRRHTLNLKLNGAMLFADAARIYSLAEGIAHTNTGDRLREYARRRSVTPLEVQAWVDGFLFIQIARLRQQHTQHAAGEALSNRVNPAHLNELESRVLKEALRQARHLQSRLALDYEL